MIGFQLSKRPAIFYGSRLTKICQNRQRYLYVWPLYRAPCNSPYFNVKLFEELENDMEIFSSLGSILLMGDSVCKEGNNLITNDQSEFSICPTHKNSFDNE